MRAIVSVASTLSMDVTAEGIETAEQLAGVSELSPASAARAFSSADRSMGRPSKRGSPRACGRRAVSGLSNGRSPADSGRADR